WSGTLITGSNQRPPCHVTNTSARRRSTMSRCRVSCISLGNLRLRLRGPKAESTCRTLVVEAGSQSYRQLSERAGGVLEPCDVAEDHCFRSADDHELRR